MNNKTCVLCVIPDARNIMCIIKQFFCSGFYSNVCGVFLCLIHKLFLQSLSCLALFSLVIHVKYLI